VQLRDAGGDVAGDARVVGRVDVVGERGERRYRRDAPSRLLRARLDVRTPCGVVPPDDTPHEPSTPRDELAFLDDDVVDLDLPQLAEPDPERQRR
jgi:hypothetical protein